MSGFAVIRPVGVEAGLDDATPMNPPSSGRETSEMDA